MKGLLLKSVFEAVRITAQLLDRINSQFPSGNAYTVDGGELKSSFNKFSDSLRADLKDWFLQSVYLTTMPIPLTEGEITLVKGVFGDEINPQIVMKYMEPEEEEDDEEDFFPASRTLGFCAGRKAVAFLGKDMHSADFSKETDGRIGLFMHEMTHVWQFQRNDAAEKKSTEGRYKYSLLEGKNFSDFRTEQQATIIEEYAMRFLKPGQPRFYRSRAIKCRPEDIGPRLQKVVEDRFPQARVTRLAVEKSRTQEQALTL